MNEQTNQLLRELAEKLGTTTEYLWLVLVRQAPISAWTTLISIVITILLCSGLIVWVNRKIKANEGANDWHICCMGLSAVVLVITFAAILIELPMIVAGLTNPEYWALKQILK